MRKALMLTTCLLVLLLAAQTGAQPMPEIVNTTGTYLVWNDYKIEINQYGGLGRDWPHDIVWEQYEFLKKKARANASPPNTIRAVLLVCPTTEATSFKKEDDKWVEAGTTTTAMTTAEVKWALDMWREWEEIIYVYSGGAAWQRTDIKVIDEPLKGRINERGRFWSGVKRDLLDKYMPFERGDYDSYNSIFNAKGLSVPRWGGTFGADFGPKGCGSSDNAWLGRAETDERHGFVFWHEWINQMCWASFNVMPYPRELVRQYVSARKGYRPDPINAWPRITTKRDMMRFVIRPKMWERWTVIDPYISPAIDTWEVFGPFEETNKAREISALTTPGLPVRVKLGTYDHFNLGKAEPAGESAGWTKPEIAQGTYYFRTYVASQTKQEVRLWAGADERFQLWLNGVMVRDGWGKLRSTDKRQLVEKVTYTTLEAGVNTLVLVLPNVDEKSKKQVQFRVRFCGTDGSGELPEGVQCNPAGMAGTIVPLKEPPVHDFKNPKLYTWAEVNDDPWLKLPRLDEAALRDLTGIETLTIKTEHVVETKTVTGKDGNEVEQQIKAMQHLFLDVPAEAVASPRVAEPTENAEGLDNDLDYNWESLAWLRVPGLEGKQKDLLLLRFDVAEPLMHLLKTKGRPGNESIVGWVLADCKLAYVVLVELDGSPTRELEALRKQPE